MAKGEDQDLEPSALQRKWEKIAAMVVDKLEDRCKVDLTRCWPDEIPALLEGLHMAFKLQASACNFDSIAESGPLEDDE